MLLLEKAVLTDLLSSACPEITAVLQGREWKEGRQRGGTGTSNMFGLSAPHLLGSSATRDAHPTVTLCVSSFLLGLVKSWGGSENWSYQCAVCALGVARPEGRHMSLHSLQALSAQIGVHGSCSTFVWMLSEFQIITLNLHGLFMIAFWKAAFPTL